MWSEMGWALVVVAAGLGCQKLVSDRAEGPAGAQLDIPEFRTQDTDGGAVVLRAVLAAYGLDDGNFAKLRQDVRWSGPDGISIDELEAVGNRRGLRVEQSMGPPERVVDEMLPCIVVVKLDDTHREFVALWRRKGDEVQVLDPRAGRKWLSRAAIERMLFVHEQPMALQDWQRWTLSSDNRAMLTRRAVVLGLEPTVAERIVMGAFQGSDPMKVGALQSALSALAALPKARRGSEELERLHGCALQPTCSDVPESLRWVRRDHSSAEVVHARGAVYLRLLGRT